MRGTSTKGRLYRATHIYAETVKGKRWTPPVVDRTTQEPLYEERTSRLDVALGRFAGDAQAYWRRLGYGRRYGRIRKLTMTVEEVEA